MEQDQRDKRLKYVDMNQVFHNRANNIVLQCKQSTRACEELAKILARTKVKTAEQFEATEKYKNYVIKTVALNEQVIELVDYIQGLLIEVGQDSKTLIDGAILRDKLMMQSDTIESLIERRESDFKIIHDLRRTQISTKQS